MTEPTVDCRQGLRRGAVRNATAIYGLDYLEVDATQTVLTVVFLGKAPPGIAAANVVLSGGRRIRDLQVVGLTFHRQTDPTLDDSMDVRVNHPGDFSTYTLRIVALDARGAPTDAPFPGLDPRYAAIDFSFKASCPSDLDCKTPHVCPPAARSEPEINYLAKDYASFRQLLFDRLAVLAPDWQETHAPDLGVALLELLAYAGDYLSYYQDAVATEAYLGTARQRISVRRHVKLVDYDMHEGANARAWVTIATDQDITFQDPSAIYFVTPWPGSGDAHAIDSTALARVPTSSYEVFEPMWPGGPIALAAAHSEIAFYTWGDRQCCLAAGTTAATLVDRWIEPPSGPPTAPTPSAAAPEPARALRLQAGDVLIFEEVLGPRTGNPADADPTHRQAVRLTRVTPGVDPLFLQPGSTRPQPIVDIEWAPEDALRFPLCLSSQGPAPSCQDLENVSVARGNVVLVDHGCTQSEPLGPVPTESTTERCPTPCQPGEVEIVPGCFRPTLAGSPLTFRQPIAPGVCSATEMGVQDPRSALPSAWLDSTPPPGDPAPVAQRWQPVPDLLDSGPGDAAFVVEIDDDGGAHLRFGDGRLGQQPAAGTAFVAHYRIGNGPAGNVGAETLTYLVLRDTQLAGVTLRPRNPLPAVSGTAPEPVAEVKQLAPFAFRDVLERAITADDYAALAADNARRAKERKPPATRRGGPAACEPPFHALQGATARLRWTGSWYEAMVAIDPSGSEDPDPALDREIAAYLEPYRRMGHDLRVAPAIYVPLDLAVTVCVLPRFLRAHVEAAVRDVLSSRVLPGGRLGLFHPDNLGFGDGVYISRIVAAVQAVPGVQEVTVTRLERFAALEPTSSFPDLGDDDLPAGGVLRLGPLEIARLDNDPSFPENGRLTLDVRGGR
jgi:hypothetical protein